LPFKNFPPTQLLDEKTLIFGNDITYDLEKDKWVKGVHVYNHTSKESHKKFQMRNGIAAFPYGKNKTTLVFPNETRLVGLGNKPKHLNFQPPFIWKNSHKAIIRYDIEKNQLDTFRFTFPLALSRKNPFKFINQKTNTWIFKKGQLFFINTLTNKKFQFEFSLDENFISMRADDCNVYLLFENKLIVKNKDEFIKEFIPYDDDKYLAQLNEFRDFRNATKISKDTEEVEVLKKLGIIKAKYSKIEHPDIQRELNLLNTNAFNSVVYETVGQLEACIRNKKIPVGKRKRCYQILISKEIRNLNFENVVQLEKDFLATVDSDKFSQDYKYYTNIDSVKNYLAKVKTLEKLNLLRDNAKYNSLGYHYTYDEDFYDSNLYKDYEKFIEEYPNSDLIDDAQFRIADFILQYIEYAQEDNTYFINKLKEIAEDYPENEKTKWINKTLEKLNEL